MAMQGMGSAPARNPAKAAGIPNKVAVATQAVPKSELAKNNAQSGHIMGPSHRGFSSNGMLPGMVKV